MSCIRAMSAANRPPCCGCAFPSIGRLRLLKRDVRSVAERAAPLPLDDRTTVPYFLEAGYDNQAVRERIDAGAGALSGGARLWHRTPVAVGGAQAGMASRSRNRA